MIIRFKSKYQVYSGVRTQARRFQHHSYFLFRLKQIFRASCTFRSNHSSTFGAQGFTDSDDNCRSPAAEFLGGNFAGFFFGALPPSPEKQEGIRLKDLFNPLVILVVLYFLF